jgi:hypothetical protein
MTATTIATSAEQIEGLAGRVFEAVLCALEVPRSPWASSSGCTRRSTHHPGSDPPNWPRARTCRLATCGSGCSPRRSADL